MMLYVCPSPTIIPYICSFLSVLSCLCDMSTLSCQQCEHQAQMYEYIMNIHCTIYCSASIAHYTALLPLHNIYSSLFTHLHIHCRILGANVIVDNEYSLQAIWLSFHCNIYCSDSIALYIALFSLHHILLCFHCTIYCSVFIAPYIALFSLQYIYIQL